MFSAYLSVFLELSGRDELVIFEALFARNPGRLDLSIVVFSAMETVITIEYKELIRDGEFEMKTQIQDFLDSKVDEWKFSVTTHLWSDHYFRLLRRHFSLQLLVENPGEEPVWVPLPYDSTISECLNLAQCRTRLTSYRIFESISIQTGQLGIVETLEWG